MPALPVPATVLVVEDDAMVRSVIRFVLARDGCDVLEAADGNAAVRVARRFTGPIHLLIADVNLPSAKGPEVWRRLAADRPGLPALFVSGGVSALDAAGRDVGGGQNFLRKPFTGAALTDKVWELIDRAAGALPVLTPAC